MQRTKYNIRLVHLLLEDDPDPTRQQKSIEQLERLKDQGIDYVQVWNRRWTEEPPRENFARPSMFDVVPIRPSHYGCFRAFADGSTDNFTEDIDAIILCEGDVKILNEETIIDSIDRAYEATQKLGIDYFSLGSKYTLESNILQSVPSEIHGDIEVVNKIIGIQMIMFPQRVREYLLDVYANSPWDGADIFLNQNFMFKKKIGIFTESPTNQWDGLSAIEDRVRDFGDKKSVKKILYVAPHLSTGGMPQFLLKRVETLIDSEGIELHVIEFNNYSDDFVVQKNKLKEILGNRLHIVGNGVTLEQREQKLLGLIDYIKPDIIHIEECPESFDRGNRMSHNTLSKLYRSNRPYQIIETCHNIWMNLDKKIWHPNSYMYCTPYHPLNNFKGTPSAGSTVEYPIEDLAVSEDRKNSVKRELGFPDKINVINVGLWTPGKNQGEGVAIARIAEERYPGKFQFHFVGNQAANFKTYWASIMENVPSNVTVWGERHDTYRFYQAADAFMFNSTWECNPLSLREAIAHRLPTFTRNLPQYLDMFTPYITPFTDDLKENAAILLRELIESGKNLGDFIPPTNDVERFKQQMLTHYSETHTTPEVKIEPKAYVTTGRTVQLHVDLLPPGNCTARFTDLSTDEIVYQTSVKPNHWYQPSQNWFTPWKVEILQDNEVIWKWLMPTQGGEVAVRFESNSLGDTLAWMAQIMEFKRHWGFKKVWVKTLKNWLWDTEYYAERGVQIVNELPDLPTTVLGVFYSLEEPWRRAEHRVDWRKIHLGQIASDRLGIPFSGERPRLAPQFQKAPLVHDERPIITFGTHSTAAAKYWQREEAWEDLMAQFPEARWIHCSKEGPRPPAEQSEPGLEVVAGWMLSSKFFVGISSGLSWFAWALGVPTFVISGFTPEVVEKSDGIWTIQNPRVCNSCWAWSTFDKGDWNWCPVWKGTNRQFECSKEISAGMVADRIRGVIEIQQERQKWSVVIPTIWKSRWTGDLLNELEASDLVDEIILIDNAVDQKPAHIDWKSYTKLRYLPQHENIYVNPAWNLGVEIAKNEMIAISNDDIVWKPAELLTQMRDGVDFIGMGKNNFGKTYGSPRFRMGASIGWGWGCLLLTRKSIWRPIPDDLKVWFGDNWIINNYQVGTLDYPGSIKGELSASAQIETFNPIKKIDAENFKKYKNIKDKT